MLIFFAALAVGLLQFWLLWKITAAALKTSFSGVLLLLLIKAALYGAAFAAVFMFFRGLVKLFVFGFGAGFFLSAVLYLVLVLVKKGRRG